MSELEVVEICAGAGGQALGLELAGFHHRLAVELDLNACKTLEANRARKAERADWEILCGDVADPELWKPVDHHSVDLLAGGVPCPPFSIAGKQLGANDERDLFAWAIEQVNVIQPRALLLENVRGLSMPRFAGYRQHVLDRLRTFGYVSEWRLLHASDFGVPQLRPRFVLVALLPEYAPYFHWPEPSGKRVTVGKTLRKLMGSRGWEKADDWAKGADDIGPTIVGGSKKHGGADLGPTRAKRAWEQLGVDALGVANEAPGPNETFSVGPKLTCEMVARLQGWRDEKQWVFHGKKTSVYRQIGNAFPPPVAEAVGLAIKAALTSGEGANIPPRERIEVEHDPIYRALREHGDFMTITQLTRKTGLELETHELERRINTLRNDFEVDVRADTSATAYKLGKFKAFTGQDNHERHERFEKYRTKIS